MKILQILLQCLIWGAHILAFVYFLGVMSFNILKQKDMKSAEKAMQYFFINLGMIIYAFLVAFAF